MFIYRKQMLLVSIISLSIALILIVFSIFAFKPFIAFFVIFFISISLLTDSILLFILFRQQEGLFQLLRSSILILLFVLLLFNYLLHRFQ